VTMGSVAHVPAMDIYDGGSTAISSDNASISSAQAFLTLPGNVCYVSPTSDDGGLIFQRAKWDVQPALQGMQIRDLQSRIANTPALVSKMPSPEDLVIVPDATSNSGYQSGVTSLSWSHTCGGSNRALAIGLHWFGSSSGFTVSNLNPTYNSVNPLGTWPASLTAENTVHALILLLLNPAAGTHTIAASWNETLDAVGTALSLVGCDQNSEAPNYGQGGNAGTSSGAGEVDGFSTILWATSFIVTAFATADSSVTLLSPQTQKQNVSGAKGTAALGYYSSSSPGDVKLGYTIGASKDWHTNSEEVPQVYSSLELEVMLMQSRICMSMP